MGTLLRVLIVDDSENDAMLLSLELKRGGYDVAYERVYTAEAMKEALAKHDWDLVISDFVMPQFNGPDALRILLERGLDLPFIITSGKISEETAVQVMRAGAHDYIMKNNLKRLVPAVQRELQEASTRRERKQAELMLASYQKDLRSLASELSLAEERERHRIAVGLHDRVSQSLSFCTMRLDSLKKSASPALAESLTEVCGLLRELLSETRSLTFELSPPVLYDLGLEAALEELAERILENNNIAFEFVDDFLPKPIDDDIRVLLFHSVRELLVNVVKHAKARRVNIALKIVGGNIQIEVADDGVGFDTRVLSTATRAGGFGFFSIRERLNYIGGSIEAKSERGKGTCITLTAPLKKEAVPS